MTRKKKQSPSKMIENGNDALHQKYCRVCWNENDWQYPSGIYGKSKGKSDEYKNGFGVEEWLLDRTRLIEGYHYGYVHALSKTKRYDNQPLDLHLYTINGVTKKRYWLGVIRNLIPVSKNKSKEVFDTYKEGGWLSVMKRQVKIAGGKVGEFNKIPAKNFFNLKFKPEDLELLDSLREFSKLDSYVNAFYYTNLYDWQDDSESLSDEVSFNFSSGHNPRKVEGTRSTTAASKKTVLLHNQMQDHIYEQLKKKYGEENVGTENQTATGARIDVVVRTGEKYDFYEIKTRNFAKPCIREALSQLMEYAYWQGKGEEVNRLIIVAPAKLGSDERRYLKYLRQTFCIPICYWTYDESKRCIIEEE